MGNILSALTDIEVLERERDAERALADRLAGLLELYFWKYEVQGDIGEISKALAAWKGARND